MPRLGPTGVASLVSTLKNWIISLLNTKANTSHTHGKSDITDLPTIPTKVSDLTNDSGYLTSHQSLANYVTLNTAQTITGGKTFSETVTISGNSGVYFDRTALTKGTNPSSIAYYGTTRVRDSATSSFYLSRGSISSSGTNSLGYALYAWGADASLSWDMTISSDGTSKIIAPNSNGDISFGKSNARWKDIYANAYYLGTTAFGDIVTHNASEFLTTHPTISTSTDTTSTGTPAHGGTFTCIDSVTRDSNGHVTTVNTKTVTLPADSNTDTKVTQAYSTTNNSYTVLSSATAGITSTNSRGATTTIVNNGIYTNPSTGALYATKLYSNGTEVLTAHQSLSNYSTLANTVKSISISGKTITVTPGSGSAYTLTTQDTVYTHPTTAGNKHVPSGGSSGQILKYSAAGTAAWADPGFIRTVLQLATRTSTGTWTISSVTTNTIIYVVGTVTASGASGSIDSVKFTSGIASNSLWGYSSVTSTAGFNDTTFNFFIAAFATATSVKVSITHNGTGSISAVSLKAYQ